MFRLLTRRRVMGGENVPRQGPLLVVANHLNLADPPLLAISLGRLATFMAKEELFHPWPMGYYFRGVGAFPVRRGQLGRQALRRTEQTLTQGLAMVIFPEGMRSRSARLQPAFSGAALVAHRSQVPILPVGITGTEKMRGLTWFWRRPRVTVNIGRPFYLSPVNGKPDRDELARMTGYIMEQIAGLLPAEYQSGYTKKGSSRDED
jgi:1-acyl-sn-glycerol-3-phosphate acyltransferase